MITVTNAALCDSKAGTACFLLPPVLGLAGILTHIGKAEVKPA